MKKFALLIIPFLLLYCKTVKNQAPAPVVNAETKVEAKAPLEIAQKRWSGTTAEDLNAGKSIYQNECTRCHKPVPITSLSEAKWQHEIDKMSPKAKLTDDQKNKLTRFILSYREANQNVGN